MAMKRCGPPMIDRRLKRQQTRSAVEHAALNDQGDTIMRKPHRLYGPAKTAISRKKLSLPALWLLRHNLIKGRVLDYGCGRGDDVRQLRKLLGVHDWTPDITGWDPYWTPERYPRGQYDTILCTYVLNVITSRVERERTLRHIRAHLAPGGYAFVSVRRDIDRDSATQRVVDVEAEFPDAALVIEVKGKYALYIIAKENVNA